MRPWRPATLQRRTRRPTWFWLLVAATTVFITLEPSLFLVTVAVGLSALTLFWILLLTRLLVGDTVAYATRHFWNSVNRDHPAPPCARLRLFSPRSSGDEGERAP